MKFNILNWVASILLTLSPIIPALWTIGIIMIIDSVLAFITEKKDIMKILWGTIKYIIALQSALLTAFLCQTFISATIPFVAVTLCIISAFLFGRISGKVYQITGLNIWEAVKEYINKKK